MMEIFDSKRDINLIYKILIFKIINNNKFNNNNYFSVFDIMPGREGKKRGDVDLRDK